jgi:hypothetical protein
MPPRGRCGTTKCFRLGVPRTPRAARRGVSRVRWRRERARLAEIRSATRAAICERRFVARNQKKKTLVSGTHPSRRGFGPVSGPLHESANCARLAAITRRRARLTVARPRRGASRTPQAGLWRRGPTIPPDPFQASRSRSRKSARRADICGLDPRRAESTLRDAEDGTERRR